MDVCESEPDVLFVHQGDVFFGLAKRCIGECSEDIEAGFGSVFMFSVCGMKIILLSYVTPSVVVMSV